MEQKTIIVYDFEELKEDIQEKVLNHFRETNDYHFLEENLQEHLREILEEYKIKCLDEPRLRYSLGYSKGDGLSFVGAFEFQGVRFYCKEGNLSNYYCHSNTIDIEMEELEDEENDGDLTEELQLIKIKEYEKTENEFNEFYHDICKKLEKIGYEEIEYQDSDENIKDNIQINEYKFTENGEIF